MHETTKRIISLFRKSDLEISTSKILESIYPDYKDMKAGLDSKDKNEKEKSKREIAQLHRRGLHHLNKLVGSGVLSVSKHGQKGEKFFMLNIRDDEEISEISSEFKKRVIISKPFLPLMPIEGYEQKGLIFKYESATWVDRLNSVVVFGNNVDSKMELYKIIVENIFPIVNDVVCVENFEEVLNKEDVSDFFEKIFLECEDYGREIIFSVNLFGLEKKENLIKVLKNFLKTKMDYLKFIFVIKKSDLEENSWLLKKLIEDFSKNKKNIHFRNYVLQKSPYFVGKAGPYCFVDSEWSLAEDLRKKIKCLACSQSSVIVDVNKFYSEYGLDFEKFPVLMSNIAKSILWANSIQRRNSGDYFNSVLDLNKGFESDFLALSRNYIRFWNFGLSQPNVNQDKVLNMISEAKKQINEFATAEETIYKSCGMTTRFKIALSCAFDLKELSLAKYNQLEVRIFDDLFKKDVKSDLEKKEILCDLFNGGNEVTIHYKGNINPENILKQIESIIINYKIPLFNYDFSEIKSNMTLLSFIENGDK